ncbi:transposase [Piscinibacter koreensis]|uniref:Mutator family transposase n=1 Tax=Piscinibacter koreensis TaxID=2742824 RepID=A0A7Y6TZB5_9BURK|nr:transposase [Schlegelella koreensis]
MTSIGTTVLASLPLCRRYQVLCANVAQLHVRCYGTHVPHDARWIIGVTALAEREILGAWISRDAVSNSWSLELQELRRRGVERVELAATGDLRSLREGLRTSFPGATALPSFAERLEGSLSQVAARHRSGAQQCLTEILQSASGLHARELLGAAESGPWGAKYPEILEDWRLALEQGWVLWTLPPALRRAVLSGDGAAAALNRSLRKAVARHGCFADVDEAHAFVVAALARAERRLQASRANAVTEHNHHREGFRPRMDALGV